MTRFREIFEGLNAQFAPKHVKTRRQAGRDMSYITARTAMNRLDEVVGPENWWDEYDADDKSVVCKLSVRLPDGTTITKWDVGGHAGMQDEGDDEKSGWSDAFKRAAVKFGVGRYLYGDDIPRFAACEPSANGSRPATVVEEREVAPREAERPKPSPPPPPKPSVIDRSRDGKFDERDPTTGKSLFVWLKHMEETKGFELIKPLNAWAKSQKWPGKMVEWNREQVDEAVAYAKKIISQAAPRPPQTTTGRADPIGENERLIGDELIRFKKGMQDSFGTNWGKVVRSIVSQAAQVGICPFVLGRESTLDKDTLCNIACLVELWWPEQFLEFGSVALAELS